MAVPSVDRTSNEPEDPAAPWIAIEGRRAPHGAELRIYARMPVLVNRDE
jgi:hypothetical protein